MARRGSRLGRTGMAKKILRTPLAWVSAGGVTRTYSTEVRFPPTISVATAQLTSVVGDGWVKIGIVAATYLPEGSKREKRLEFLGRPEDWRPSFAADRMTSVTFALWLHSRGGLAAASAQGLVFQHGSAGKATKDDVDPSDELPMEPERRGLVYDPKTGIVQHSFGVVATGGAKPPSDKDMEAAAQALVQGMGDRDKSAVLSVSKSALERSMLYRVDPRTRKLQAMTVTRKPVESRAPRRAVASAAKAAPSAQAA